MPSVENTKKTLELAVQRARELNIQDIVVASNTGATVKRLLSITPNEFNVTCVTRHFGFLENGKCDMNNETRKELMQKGINVLTTTHLMAGLDRALRFKFQGVYPAEIVASALRMFGQGVKVCIEVAGMALDAGYIPYGKEIIVIAGTEGGADTALVITPAHSNYFFDTKVKEIICKPREF